MLAVALLVEHLDVHASPQDVESGGGKPRSRSEAARRWGVTVETLTKVEELGREVDIVYQGWVNSRDRTGAAAFDLVPALILECKAD